MLNLLKKLPALFIIAALLAIGARVCLPRLFAQAPAQPLPAAGNTSIAATTMLTPAAAGSFRLNLTASQTLLGTGCTGNSTIAVNAIYQDPNAAAAQTVTAVATFTITTNGTLGQVPLTSGAQTYFLRSRASAAIQYSTTYTPGAGCAPAPIVQLYPFLENVGF